MNLVALELSNYLCFTNSRFDFDPQLNLIIGGNGSGKSSLLSAICSGLAAVVFGITGKYSLISIGVEEVRFETQIIGGRVRFERCYPSTIGVSLEVFGQHLEGASIRNTEGQDPDTVYPIFKALRDMTEFVDQSSSMTLPFIACYGAQRNAKGKGVSLSEAAAEKISRRSAYNDWWDAFADRDDLENWVIGKTLERLQLVSEGEDVAKANDDELRIVNAALRDCIPGATELKYDLRLRALVLLFEECAIPFTSLSDGQQGMIALVADIARRICILNPHLSDEALRETDGILCIDEIDIHLHPAWQRSILKHLRTKFPKLQIFATSHSPQMVGGLMPNQVMILKDGKVQRPQITYGLDSGRILEEVMGSDSREPKITKILKEMFISVETGDLEGAKKQLASLRGEAPDLPEYSQVEALIRRKEILGR